MACSNDKEIKSILKNKTWDLVDLLANHNNIYAKWVYKMKEYKKIGPIYKARLVARSVEQQKGIDYNKTFAYVATWITLRILLTLSAQMGWKLYHMDVKTILLNRDLLQEIYMLQTEGLIVTMKETKVCKLRKTLYDLNLALIGWYTKNSYL